MASRQDAPPPASRQARSSGGRNIGQFVIDKEIGKGSFAQVYMGWHKVRQPSPNGWPCVSTCHRTRGCTHRDRTPPTSPLPLPSHPLPPPVSLATAVPD